jgi:hypothetical protein
MPLREDDDMAGPAVSVADSGDTGESGKLKMIISLLKKVVGVKDIASMCMLSDFYYNHAH